MKINLLACLFINAAFAASQTSHPFTSIWDYRPVFTLEDIGISKLSLPVFWDTEMWARYLALARTVPMTMATWPGCFFLPEPAQNTTGTGRATGFANWTRPFMTR